MKKRTLITNSPEETIVFAKSFAKQLKQGAVICLSGDLGSGKTTFVKGLALGLGLKDADIVKSPTFVLMHIYKAKFPIYHFDCYRLNSEEDLVNIGFSDFVNDKKAITCIEWPDAGLSLIPPDAYKIKIKIKSSTGRQFRFC